MEEILVYKSVLDASASISSIEQMRKVNALFKKDLEQVGDTGSEGYKRIADEAQRTGKTIEQVQQDLKTVISENTGKINEFTSSIKNVSKGTGSIADLRKEVINLKNTYIQLSEAERNNAEGKAMQQDLLEKTNQLKDLEKAIGITSRNVGNYSEAFKGAFAELDLGGKVTDLLREHIAGADAVMKIFSQTANGLTAVLEQSKSELKNSGDALSGVASGSEAGAEAMEGASTSAKALTASAAALSIPLILIGTAVAAVVAYFSRFDDAGESLEQVISGLSEVAGVLVDRLAYLGAALKDIVTGDFTAAIEDGKKAFTGLTESISEAYEAGKQYKAVMQEIEDQQRAFSVTSSAMERDIARLVLQSKNRTLSEKERIAAIDEANKIEKQRLAIQQETTNAQLIAELDRLSKVKKIRKDDLLFLAENLGNETQLNWDQLSQLEEVKNRRGALADDDLKLITDLLAKRNDAERESLMLTEKNENRRDALLQEFKKKKDDADKKAQDAEKKRLEAEVINNQNRIKLMQEGLEKQLAILDAGYDDQLNKAKETGASVNLITQVYLKDREKIISEFYQKAAELIQANEANVRELLVKSSETQLDDENLSYEKQLKQFKDFNDRKVIETLKAQGLTDEQINQMRESQYQAEQALSEEHNKKLSEIELNEFFKRINAEDTALLLKQSERNKALADRLLNEKLTEDQSREIQREAQEQSLLELKQVLERRIALIQQAAKQRLNDSVLMTPEEKAAFEKQMSDLNNQLAQLETNLKGLRTDKDGKVQSFGEMIGLSQEQLGQATEYLNSIAKVVGSVGQILKNLSDERINELEQEKQTALDNANLTASQRTALEKKYNAQITAERKKAGEEQQAISITEAVIAGAVGIASAWKSGNPIAGAVISALIAAVVASQVALIASKKFKRGGVLSGPSHDDGGVQLYGPGGAYYGEAEGGEAILTRGVTANRKALGIVSAINEAHGGVALGGIPLPKSLREALMQHIGGASSGVSIASAWGRFAGGGITSFPATTVQQIGNKDLIGEVRALREEFKKWQPVVAVTDINEAQDKVKLIEENSYN